MIITITPEMRIRLQHAKTLDLTGLVPSEKKISTPIDRLLAEIACERDADPVRKAALIDAALIMAPLFSERHHLKLDQLMDVWTKR